MSQYPAIINVSGLDGDTGYRLRGAAAGDKAGMAVSAVGDINGDGRVDYAVGASANDTGATDAGAVYVLFGTDAGFPASIDLSALNGTTGFKIFGAPAAGELGASVSAAGDINDDGIADLIIGAPGADLAYVVFGAASFGATVDAGSLNGSNGFAIVGEGLGSRTGTRVAGGEDLNGDGIADVVIGAPGPLANSEATPEAAYVVFGRNTSFSSSVSLTGLNGTAGYKITGDTANGVGDDFGFGLATGDFDGDGIGDVIVGGYFDDFGGGNRGSAYLIYGGATTGSGGSLSVASLNGSNGFRINGAVGGDWGGYSFAFGDINGDGFADLIVDSPFNDPNGVSNAGAVHVVLGHAAHDFGTTFVLSAIDGTNGFKINGVAANDQAGHSVATGDINGDGFDDVVLGSGLIDPNGSNSGSLYVVFGGPGGPFPATIEVSALDGTAGFKVNGVASNDTFGDSVSVADVNGDGIADILVGAVGADVNGSNSGAAYVVFGRAPDAAVSRTGSSIGQTIVGGDFGDTLDGVGGDDTLIGGGGGDTLIGGTGSDTLIGGIGTDTAVIAATWLQTTIVEVSPGTFQLTVGADTDTATDIELFAFDNGTFAAATILNDNPVATNDSDNTLVEAGKAGAGTAATSGDVLANDTDADDPLGDSRTVAGVRTGSEGAGGSLTGIGAGVTITGTYGALTIGANGGWSYALDNNDADTQALALGAFGTETFTYQITDAKGLTDLAELSLTIQGDADNIAPVAGADTGYLTRGSTLTVTTAQLMENDSDPDNDALTITGVSNAANGTVSLSNGVVTFTATSSTVPSTATFDYTLSDGALTTTGHVTLNLLTSTAAANTLSAPTLAGQFSYLDGLGGPDTLTGGAGRDVLIGGTGADTIDGGAGDDVIAGGTANDTLIGGTGIDTADYSSFGGAVMVNLSTVGIQDTGTASGMDSLSGFENLLGGIANDKLTGTTGVNIIRGGAGGDLISGLGGADILFGEEGNDNLQGGNGNDILIGGVGRDLLTGGGNNDIFRFVSASETAVGGQRDQILDFESGSDVIDLAGIDANSSLAGDQAFSFIGTAAFSGSAGQLRFYQAAGQTIVEGDLDGNNTADFQVQLRGLYTLQQTDFVV